jgi:hypothetical protein
MNRKKQTTNNQQKAVKSLSDGKIPEDMVIIIINIHKIEL